MGDQRNRITGLCKQAIEKVDEAIAKHEAGEPADLSISMLHKVRIELETMSVEMSSSKFKPSYPRFVMDWPDEHGLIAYLVEVSYQYSRLTK